VRQILDVVWEASRYRGMITALIDATEQQALQKVLRPLVHGTDDGSRALFKDGLPDVFGATKSEVLAWRYILDEKEVVEEVDRLLESAGLTWQAIKAEAFSLRIDHVERINKMIISAEARRNSALREIERHRANFGQRLRGAAKRVEERENPGVGNQSSDQRRAA